LKLLVDDKVASNTVTSAFLSADIPLADFIAKLEEKGFTVYSGKGPLKERNMFQIANMGEINEKMCHKFIYSMGETLQELKPWISAARIYTLPTPAKLPK
jgi:aspartate aminotransferase-like enzyme